MAPPERGRSSIRPLDAVALARVQRRLNAAAAPPWLHGEVARRMAERLPIVKLRPDTVVDWGSFLGASQDVLRQAYPQARLLLVEPGAPRRDATQAALERPWWSPGRWTGAAPRVFIESELAAGQAQLLWANMGLHGAIDPQVVMSQWHRALAVDGFLMFSTLGPGSLPGLRALYAAQRWPPPFAPFVDMHDLGDMLIEAGFADPVMDQETITITWPSAKALLAELRTLGGNVDQKRFAGLRTARWRAQLEQALSASASADGRVAMAFEVVYGHAFRPPPRPRLSERTEVPLDDLRAMARAGRRPG
jgi:malonyl-CoA O-methyltransferase